LADGWLEFLALEQRLWFAVNQLEGWHNYNRQTFEVIDV
jgi:hypothetical protein